MQRIPVAIASAQLTATATAYYTTPAGTKATISNLSFTNTTAAPATVTLHRVPASGAAAASNMIASAYSVPANGTYMPPQAIGLHLEAGMTLQALASTALAITVAGGVYETSGS